MNLVYYIIILPIISSFLLILLQNFIRKIYAAIISIGLMLISFLISIYTAYIYYHKVSLLTVYMIPLWQWLTIHNHIIKFTLLVDSLSVSMLIMITCIGLFIQIFSFWYMYKDKDYIKYFFYINIFIACMIMLVLSSNLIFMFFSWELVGIFSFLLIGFYNNKVKNGYCAIKSFLMTRIPDIFFLIAIFLMLIKFHTIDFYCLDKSIKFFYYIDNNAFYLFWIAFFLLIAAIGKSAQFPFHTWLVDAMVGPTPGSALIHAATMVTSGVFLIVRTYPIFESNENIKFLLSCIGILTFLISSYSAIFEKNIKRILAYSTISQLGYMFFSLGENNPIGAIWHLINHAFFKALLFLIIGFILKNNLYQQNIYKLGGLYKKIPFIYINFIIGSLSLISFPYITSSFYSKESILFSAFYKHDYFFLIMGILGVFLTSVYTSRMFFLMFHGKIKTNKIQFKRNYFCYVSFLLLTIGCSPYLWKIIAHYFLKNYISNNLHTNSYLYIEYYTFIVSISGILCSYFFSYKKIFKFDKFFPKFCLFFLNHIYKISNYIDTLYFYLFVDSYNVLTKFFNNDPLLQIIRFFIKIFYFFSQYSIFIKDKFISYHINWFLLSIILVLLSIFFI